MVAATQELPHLKFSKVSFHRGMNIWSSRPTCGSCNNLVYSKSFQFISVTKINFFLIGEEGIRAAQGMECLLFSKMSPYSTYIHPLLFRSVHRQHRIYFKVVGTRWIISIIKDWGKNTPSKSPPSFQPPSWGIKSVIVRNLKKFSLCSQKKDTIWVIWI